jgi:hypothetical protein
MRSLWDVLNLFTQLSDFRYILNILSLFPVIVIISLRCKIQLDKKEGGNKRDAMMS